MDTLFFASSFCWPLSKETKQNPFSLYSHKLHVQHIGFYGAGNSQSSHIRAQLNHSRISRQETPAANHAATCEDLCTSVIGLCDTVVGVLGGGQLGRMLCQAASKMGVKVAVLDPLENCPASALAYKHVVGSFRDTNAVQEFAKGCGVLTVEIEHVDVETLEMLEEQGVDCQPNSSTIRLIQDKYLQKIHFSQHDVPLPDFMQIDCFESAEKAGDLFSYPLVIKSRRLAYDGRGNAVAYCKEDITAAVSGWCKDKRKFYRKSKDLKFLRPPKWSYFIKHCKK